MSTVTKIIETIDEIVGTSSYIKKKDKDYVTRNLELIEDKLTKKETTEVEKAIILISNQKINMDDRRQLQKIKPSLKKILRKYEEKFIEEPDDNINQNLTTNQVEKLLDYKIDAYNKFNQMHPMHGVTWNESKNKYQIKYDGIDTYSKDLDTACKKIMEKNDRKNSGMIVQNSVKMHFVYSNHYFLTYWYESEPYFDVRHVISVLKLSKTSRNDKYNDVYDKGKIAYYTWFKNEYNGYFLRELVNEKIMYNIIMNSNSDISKKFKDDVAEILIELRKTNRLNLTNNKLTLTTKNYKNMDDDNDNICKSKHPIYRYVNSNHKQFIQKLIYLGSVKTLSKYSNKHILYAFIIPLKIDDDCIVIKFGYCFDIIERIESLTKEYGSKLYFINAKIVSGEKDERKFHKILKKNYNELVQPYRINGKEKTELYKFSPILMKEFYSYLNDNDDFDEIYHFVNSEIISSNNNLFSLNAYYDYLKTKENNHHEKILTELKYKNIDKEIKLTEAKIKLALLNKKNTKFIRQ